MLSLHCRVLLLIITLQGVSRVEVHGQRREKSPAKRLQFCHWPCKCGQRPQCQPGVSSVLDGCGCCKSCAKQIGEVCNERDVCDPHKGMYCDFSADTPNFQLGVCAYLLGVGCDLNGGQYENGEAFQPSPLYKCTCIAGVIGCTPAFLQKPAALLGPAPLIGNKAASLSPQKHAQDTVYMSAYRDPNVAWKKNCLIQTTIWSPCSKSCGLGISVRVTNDNRKCEMTKERRLCQLRPCRKNTRSGAKVAKGKRCQAQFQATRAEVLRLSGCTSTRSFRPTYCGTCTHLHRCCSPNKSRIIKVTFTCSGGTQVEWKMQWITSCVCLKTCAQSGDMFSHLHLI
ncbi:cellular communication network factor 6 [Nerophis lumbriciformis]|uniref:cellular communication network factor 6 n=1 Tax=Nerophis lumbriciformis TaxID=546530 RepID=UPI002ADF4444|nr:cellular communication network factor 6 isoform X1 [Nerophis lumbriciformis]